MRHHLFLRRYGAKINVVFSKMHDCVPINGPGLTTIFAGLIFVAVMRVLHPACILLMHFATAL